MVYILKIKLIFLIYLKMSNHVYIKLFQIKKFLIFFFGLILLIKKSI